MTPEHALQALRDGNLRYLAAKQDPNILRNTNRFHGPIMEQKPFVAVLSCSDSRVPVEQVFDQGSGDIFVVRVAGNIVTSSQLGSLEFACQKFAVPLIVVLGHSYCGAIEAATFTEGDEQISNHLQNIIDEIHPVSQKVIMENPNLKGTELLEKVKQANVKNSMKKVLESSDVINTLVQENKVNVVGAAFCIETSEVQFY